METDSEGSSMRGILLCFLTVMIDLTRFCEACGGQIRDFPGTLRSPDNDGDGLYDNNLRCDCTIIADEDHVVDFFLYELDLDPDCTDIIFLLVAPIYYGRTICGNNLTEPIRVISDGRILVVDFGTNNEVTGRGFAALLIQVADLQRECGGILNGTVGIIQSRPFDPLDNYERQFSCSWAIVVPDADVVFFEFETIDVDYDATCSKKLRSAISARHTTVMTRESTTEALGILFPSSTDVNYMNGGDKKHHVYLVLIFYIYLQMLLVS